LLKQRLGVAATDTIGANGGRKGQEAELQTMSHIATELAGPVGIITIDRAERFNSLDVATAQDLRKAGLRFARDAAVRAVVIRGANGIFCSGADLKYIGAGGDADDLRYLVPAGHEARAEFGELFKQVIEYIHSTISEIKRAPKPFIAAVDGIAAAGGFGIAMACDLVLASERASFEWAYSRTGLTGAESSTFFLPRLIGLRRAMELILLNPRIGAGEAMRMGLVNRVWPSDRFDGEVLSLARRLAEGPTGAYAVAKQLINQAAGVDRLDYHLDQELEGLARIAEGGDFARGIAAFFAKEPARFKGK
jgi:2-(1,2-epoxy-1,2-dihydrophenyl)acetyl-CoA isomerase